MRAHDRALWAIAVILSVLILVGPALWNGFPLLQYDTGGYLSAWYDGRLHINRSAPYGLLLVAGQEPDFWPVLLLQSALTVWVLALTLRAHRFGNRPLLLLAMIAALSIFTTLPWLTAILLTDIFAGLAVLALYLLLLRDDTLTRGERVGLVVFVAASMATHSATMLVLCGLLAVATIVWFVDRARITTPRLMRGVATLLLGTLIVLFANALVTGRFGWAYGGYALSFGRMLQDGIVKNFLDDHCPDPTLRLCPYKDQLPHDADEFFWASDLFNNLGRFDGMRGEMRRIALESLADYPILQLESAFTETAKQLTMVETGAGVVKWVVDTYYSIKDHVPAAMPGMLAARQRHPGIEFTEINRLQVPLAYLAMALSPVIALVALRRQGFGDIGELAAVVALAILANATVFGTFATAHNRYGARLIWLPAFVALIALARLAASHRALSEATGLPRQTWYARLFSRAVSLF
ncbi:MAG: hypothetical protein ACREB8_06155 [Pseudolabrys sp.]